MPTDDLKQRIAQIRRRLSKVEQTLELMRRTDDDAHADAYIRDVEFLRGNVLALIDEIERLNEHNERLAGVISEQALLLSKKKRSY